MIVNDEDEVCVVSPLLVQSPASTYRDFEFTNCEPNEVNNRMNGKEELQEEEKEKL